MHDSRQENRNLCAKTVTSNYDVFDERRYFKNGKKTSPVSFKTNGKEWKLGVIICEDMWNSVENGVQPTYSVNPVNALEGEDIDLLINLSASPFGIGKRQARVEKGMIATSVLNCPLIYVNQVGGNDDLVFDGSSFIMNSNGNVVKQLKSSQSDYQSHDFPLTQKTHEVTDLSSEEELYNALILGLRDYVSKMALVQ